MRDANAVLSLVDTIYSAALDEEKWPAALFQVSEFCDGRGVVLFRATTEGAIQEDLSVGIDEGVRAPYLDRYASLDSRNQMITRLPSGRVAIQSELVNGDDFRKGECFNEFCVPFDIPELMVVLLQKRDHLMSLAIQRSAAQEPFRARDAARFSTLVPHLMRTVELRAQLAEVRHASAAHLDIIDRLPFGVLFLDDGGRLIECSAAGRALLGAGQAIGARGRRLHAELPDDDRVLQRVIFDTLNCRRLGGLPGGSVVLRRSRHRLPLHVTVLPAPAQRPLLPSRVACMVVVIDPETATAPAADLIQRVLKLTPAEASLACALFGGRSMKEAALELGRTVNTCKSQLKSVYSKTGCRNHAELTRYLLQVGLADAIRSGTGRAT